MTSEPWFSSAIRPSRHFSNPNISYLRASNTGRDKPVPNTPAPARAGAYVLAQSMARGSLMPCAKPPSGVFRKSSRPNITRIS